jgi:hypothetical protein
MGDKPIIIEQIFYGFEGVIMGSIMGSQNIMGSDYGSNISAVLIQVVRTDAQNRTEIGVTESRR